MKLSADTLDTLRTLHAKLLGVLLATPERAEPYTVDKREVVPLFNALTEVLDGAPGQGKAAL